jgi:hypothetical protein
LIFVVVVVVAVVIVVVVVALVLIDLKTTSKNIIGKHVQQYNSMSER